MLKTRFFQKISQTFASFALIDFRIVSPFSSCLIILPTNLSWIVFFIIEQFVDDLQFIRPVQNVNQQIYFNAALLVYFICSGFIVIHWKKIDQWMDFINFLAMGSYLVFYLSTTALYRDYNHNDAQENFILFWEGITVEFLIICSSMVFRKISLKIVLFFGINIYIAVLKMKTREDLLYTLRIVGALVSSLVYCLFYRKAPRRTTYTPNDGLLSPKVLQIVTDSSEKAVGMISHDWKLIYKNQTFSNLHIFNCEDETNFKQILKGIMLQNFQEESHGRRKSLQIGDNRLIRSSTDSVNNSIRDRKGIYKRSLFGTVIGLRNQTATKVRDNGPEPASLYEAIEKIFNSPHVSLNPPNPLEQQAYTSTYLAQIEETNTVQIKIRQVEENDLSGVILIISDYSIQEKVNRLTAAERLHTISLASITHELRSPLTSTLQFLETIYNNNDIPIEAKNNNIGPAIQNVKYTLVLVNDILDFAQLKENKLKLTYTKTSIQNLVKEACAIVEISAKNKRLHFSSDLDSSVPENFVTDANRLKQVIINLLSNAVKFTMKGSIKLTVENRADSWLWFSVKDTGIGIKPEDQKKLFKEYGKIDLGDKQLLNLNGVGLGLNISNKLVKALSDEDRGIQVESKYRKGSTFSFRIRNKINFQRQQTREVSSMQGTGSIVKSVTQNGSEDVRSNSLIQLKTLKTNKSLHKRIVNGEFSSFSLKDKADRISSYLSSNHIELTSEDKSDEENFGEYANEKVEVYAIGSPPPKKPFIQQKGIYPPPRDEEKKKEIFKNVIFLIDDDQYILMATSQIITNLGMTCVQFFDIEEVMKRILGFEKGTIPNSYPSLILIDYNMPLWTGAEVSKMIRLIQKINKLPTSIIIGLTGAGDNLEVKESCMEAGMDDVFEKPLTPDKLQSILNRYELGKL